MKINVDIYNNELDAMEDLIVAWNLCDKHNGQLKASDKQLWNYTQTCPECKEMNKKLRGKALHLWSKLCSAYDKTKGKRKKN